MRTLLLVALVACRHAAPPPAAPATAPAISPDAETVVVTYLPKADKEAELQKEIEATWQTILDLKLAASPDHTFYKGTDESGKPFFIEIFSWRDHDAPDHAPPALTAHWKVLNDLVEARGERGAIEFFEIHRVPQGGGGSGSAAKSGDGARRM